MDPDENLRQQRQIRRRILDRETKGLYEEDAVRLAELSEAMDEWLGKGGFLPAPWSLGR